MKKIILTLTVAIFGITACIAQTTSEEVNNSSIEKQSEFKTIVFGVNGNCGMCKRTIEKAAVIEGVAEANWDMAVDSISVTFDESITKELMIHNAIAASGYDTDKVKASDESYNGLAGCCQYDRSAVETDEPAN